MSTIRFNITNENTQSGNESVLVFLKPVIASSNFRFYAWQTKNPAPNGGTSAFDFSVSMSAKVTNANLDSSRVQTVLADQLWNANQTQNDGLQLVQVVPLPSTAPITPEQVGIHNMVPDDYLTATFYIDEKPVVDAPNLNPQSYTTFQLEAALWFMAAAPTVQGPNYTLQLFSDSTKYVVPANVTSVNVTWSRPAGVDNFAFDPPSAPIPPS